VVASLRPVVAAFAVFGSYAGAWAVAAIDIEHSYDLSDGELGMLLAVGIFSATALAAVGGWVVKRWGAGASLAWSLLAWGLLLTCQAAAPQLAPFALAFVLASAAGGVIDVVMNVIAADALAHEPGRLVQFHGLFNAGSVVGAALTGIVLRAGGSWRAAWIAIAVVSLVAGLYTRRTPVPEPPPTEHPSMLRAMAGLRHEGLLVLATVFSAGAMVEGGLATWGVLYLREHLDLGVLVGVGAYVAGQTLSTLARVGGGPAIRRLGPRRAVALGGALAATGITAEVLSDFAPLAAAGLAVATVGISVVWPLLLATVNNEARDPTIAIGGITACGYFGMVVGPPIVGALSSLFGLRPALLFLAAVGVFVAVTPAHVRTRVSRLDVA
jgi:MFS family permease